LRHVACVRVIMSNLNSPKVTQAELRQLRATGKRIASNKKSARRFLVSIGMYTAKCKLKPQLR